MATKHKMLITGTLSVLIFFSLEYCTFITTFQNLLYSFATFLILTIISESSLIQRKQAISPISTQSASPSTTKFHIKHLTKHKNLTIERVTKSTAAKVQHELNTNGGAELSRLVQKRLTRRYVYDFFCCVAGEHLRGSSLLKGRVPEHHEYTPGGNFYWSGIQIHIVRDTSIPIGKPGSIQGICVFHDAYLSSYPGPTNFFHNVDPVLTHKKPNPFKKSHKKKPPNFGMEFNDEHASDGVGQGSRKWCDIPILAGPGIGRLILAHCIDTRCNSRNRNSRSKSDSNRNSKSSRRRSSSGGSGVRGVRGRGGRGSGRGNGGNTCSNNMVDDKVKFFISVAGGEGNKKMLALLARFKFKQLHMSHPKSRVPWLDEAGAELFVLSRQGSLKVKDAKKLLSLNTSSGQRRNIRKSKSPGRSRSRKKKP
tara:strand:- start:9 stop:1277 length:1269 start_codon:yes stop_codon:yes gene_type:complete